MGRPKLLTTDDVIKAIRATTQFRVIAVPPSIETIRQYLDVGSTRTIFRYLNELEQMGVISRRQGEVGVRLIAEPDGQAPARGKRSSSK